MKRPPSTNSVRAPAEAGSGLWLPAGLFVVLGLATSLTLIPRDYELALRDLDAGASASAIARLERLQAQGDRSPSVAAALARAYIDSGDLESAVLSMEALSRLRPDDMEVLQALADLDIGTGRVAEYLAVLERQQAIAPEKARQERIAALYGELGDTAGQRAALWTLVGTFEAEEASLLELARLEAAEGRLREALAVLDLRREAFGNGLGEDAVSLAIVFELALGNDRRAIERGQEWLAGRKVLSRAVAVVSKPFQTQRRYDLLIELIEPHVRKGAPLEVFAAMVDAHLNAGDLDAVDGVLDRMKIMTGSRPEAMQERLRLAHAAGNIRHMLEIARVMAPDAIPDYLIKDVARVAIVRNDLEVLREIAERAGGRFFHDDPGLAASIMIALHEFEAARAWVEVARSKGDDHPAVLLSAVEADYQLGRAARSLQTLRGIFGDARQVAAPLPGGASRDAPAFPYERLPQDQLTTAARLYIGLGAPHEGRAALDRYRRAYPSREADFAWALAAAAAGAGNDIQLWQAEAADLRTPPEFLNELANYAMNAGAFDLAVSAASRLVAARGSDADKILMATAMHLASQPLQLAAIARDAPPEK